MKKLLVINICALLLMFLTAGVIAKPNTDSQQIESLLEQRIFILNSFYGQKTTFDETRDNLEKIASDSLLRGDINLMEAYDAAEVDQVIEYEMEIISCKRTSYGIIKGQADIFWVMQGQTDRWTTEESYYFTAEDDQGKIKLTQLKKI